MRDKKKLETGIKAALDVAITNAPVKLDNVSISMMSALHAKIAVKLADSIHSYIDDAHVSIEKIRIAAGIPITATGTSAAGPITVTGQTTAEGSINDSDKIMIEIAGKIM